MWTGIEAGASPDSLAGSLFEDSHGTFHGITRRFVMTDFYIQPDDPMTVRIVFDHGPRQVCGVNIEGERSRPERDALLAELGPPKSLIPEELLFSPGGSAALNDGGKFFRVWTWQKGLTLVTFEERVRQGYFLTLYRPVKPDGRPHRC